MRLRLLLSFSVALLLLAGVVATAATLVSVDLGEDCALVHDGFEAAVRGEAAPTSYSL